PKNRKVFFRVLKYAAGIMLLAGIGITLYLLLNRPVTEDPITYTAFQTSYGEKKEITLPDNTKVWLNSGTLLQYPSNYGKVNREVVLQGEAYFNVTRDESKTFIVKADNIIIKVLGTSFNVNCYHEQKTVETTVVSGVVSLESNIDSPEKSIVILNKSEKATYLKNENRIIIDDTSNDIAMGIEANPLAIKKIILGEETMNAVIGWKDQDLVFDNETLEEMALKLRRWYNVSIVIKDEHLKQYRYKGRFKDVKSIFQVLEVVKLTTPITYEYNENKKEIIVKEMK
ncbi:MAG: FecR family protein, partial [Bacteroidales bacterium]|nr:FecR family protein [Bacteroidales bacterium]